MSIAIDDHATKDAAENASVADVDRIIPCTGEDGSFPRDLLEGDGVVSAASDDAEIEAGVGRIVIIDKIWENRVLRSVATHFGCSDGDIVATCIGETEIDVFDALELEAIVSKAISGIGEDLVGLPLSFRDTESFETDKAIDDLVATFR